jgi:hypothetical protein
MKEEKQTLFLKENQSGLPITQAIPTSVEKILQTVEMVSCVVSVVYVHHNPN